jgi:two-component system sensor histidine kinase EvgS
MKCEGTQVEAIMVTAPSKTVNFDTGQLILIIDHYRVGQRTALLQLQYFGLKVQVVSSCRAAIKAVKGRSYSLVLIGWGMPNCTGKAFIEFARRQDRRRNTHTTIVAVTANARSRDKPVCLALGMDDFMCKPITMDDMKDMLGRHLHAA